jgi:hypothetical protein
MKGNPGRARLIVPLLLLSISCRGEDESAAGIFFPTHESGDSPSSQAFGTLQVSDDCLVLTNEVDHFDLLPIWPSGFSFDGNVLRNGDGTVVAKLSDRVELGGGGITATVAADLIGREIPDRCVDASPFMVSEVLVSAG